MKPLSLAERQIADDLLSHNLDLLRLSAGVRDDALTLLLKLERELTQRLRAGVLTEYGQAALEYLVASAKAVINSYYETLNQTAGKALAGVSETASAAIRASLIDVGYGAALSPETHFAVAVTDTLIQGAPSAMWWSKQSSDTAFRFANEVRKGIVQGKANGEIIANVRSAMTISRANAAALVQTSVQTVANEASLATFRDNADVIKGVKQLSTLDSHTTDICVAYSGAEWDLDGKAINGTTLPFNGGPPRHWNCRSVLVPITKTFKELGLDIPEMPSSERASSDGPVEATMTFDAFLKRKGEKYQNDTLGKGRAELWRSGTITLPQLLDMKGNPLTLAELKAKYA